MTKLNNCNKKNESERQKVAWEGESKERRKKQRIKEGKKETKKKRKIRRGQARHKVKGEPKITKAN